MSDSDSDSYSDDDSHTRAPEGGGALHEAVRKLDVDAVRRALAAGASADVLDDAGRTPLYIVCSDSENIDIIFGDGFNFGGDDEAGKWNGRARERSAIVDALLAAGANVHIECGDDSMTPLQCAVWDGGGAPCDIVGMLIAAGADIEAGHFFDDEHAARCPLLYLAAQRGSAKTVAELIAAGANPHRRMISGPGHTVMEGAAPMHNFRVYPHLLRAGLALPPVENRNTYLTKVAATPGGFKAYEKEHRRRLTAVFADKFPALPVEVISHIVLLLGHCGEYLY